MMNLDAMKYATIAFACLIFGVSVFPVAAIADDEHKFSEWIYPGEELSKGAVSKVGSVGEAEESKSVVIQMGFYNTEAEFHEVVAFYVRKSGLTPPNWKILGREFPGTDVYLPAHFSDGSLTSEKPSVTLMHYIRENVATAQLLVTNHPEIGSIAVSITRSKDDQRTRVNLIHHARHKGIDTPD